MGSIELIIGCMFSGKSTETIRLVKRFQIINKSCLILKHNTDTRYDEGNKLSTHDRVQIECISTDKLIKYLNTDLFNRSDIIVVEEGQFFSDLFDFATISADKYNKTIIINGLDGDYKRDMFGDVLRLIPHAEKITRLNALCCICNDGTKAFFTKRITENNSIKLIGNEDYYQAVCRKHYN